MAAARSTGPPMPSGSFSLGGTAIVESLPAATGAAGMAPVTSLAGAGEGAACGGVTMRALSSVFGAGALFDCLSSGVGEISEGPAGADVAGLAPLSDGAGDSVTGSVEFSTAGIAGGLPVSSSVIAILNVPSTITTTLAPTSSERIREVTADVDLSPGTVTLAPVLVLSLTLSLAAAFAAARAAFSLTGASAAACAARRAAAMKLDELTGSFGPAAISLIALSEAAIRSDGEDIRAEGRVPGSSG